MPSYDEPSLDYPSLNPYAPVPKFYKDVDPRYICPKCTEVLRDPMQTECGHRVCKTCLNIMFDRQGGPVMCPVGEVDCVQLSRTNNSIHPDFSAKREIKQLEVECHYHSKGCTEIMKWALLDKHLAICEYNVIPCQNAYHGCVNLIKKMDLQHHLENECNYRKVHCPHCSANNILAIDLQKHLHEDCPDVSMSCPNQCGVVQTLLRKELPAHLSSCPARPRHCRYHDILHCDFKGSAIQLDRHMKDTAIMMEHFDLAVSQLDQSNIRNVENMNKIKALEQDVIHCRNNSLHATSECNNLRSLSTECRSKLKDLQRVMAGQVEEKIKTSDAMNDVMQEFTNYATKSDISKLSKEQEATQQATRRLEGKVGFGDTSSAESMREKIQSHNKLFSENDSRMTAFDLRFHLMETACFDGVLLWKIKEYNHRKREAVEGRVISLYSQPFYTSRHGYKLCARIYLNGDGIGKGTHISLFFVVMQGEYDNLLKWPFRQKATMILMDQQGENKNLQDSFRPDPSSSSFQKPQSRMNVATGCPLFVSQSVIEKENSRYKKDDSIFIKIAVDTQGLTEV